jgi:Hypervirulence associated proteins TUDOR domain
MIFSMTKFKPYKIGTAIQWKWAGGIIDGKVEEVFEGPIEKEIKGKKIKRNGSVEKPAYLVRSEAGNLALKLHTELISQD